jgi:hypothetical protein
MAQEGKAPELVDVDHRPMSYLNGGVIETFE